MFLSFQRSIFFHSVPILLDFEWSSGLISSFPTTYTIFSSFKIPGTSLLFFPFRDSSEYPFPPLILPRDFLCDSINTLDPFPSDVHLRHSGAHDFCPLKYPLLSKSDCCRPPGPLLRGCFSCSITVLPNLFTDLLFKPRSGDYEPIALFECHPFNDSLLRQTHESFPQVTALASLRFFPVTLRFFPSSSPNMNT